MPAQDGFEPEVSAMLTEGVMVETTDIVILLDVTVLALTQPREVVRRQVTILPLVSVVVV